MLALAACMALSACGRRDAGQDSSHLAPPEAPGSGSIQEDVTVTPTPTAGTFTLQQGYSDPYREVSIVGLKEYKKIKTEKFTDKAGKGKKYLVLFLKIRNRSNEKIYFNVNYLGARLDGEEIENTFLLNEPEGYPTVFSNIAPDSYYGGFIAWEVPEGWKKMEITYNGWRDSDGLTLNSMFTRKELEEPEEYSSYTYSQDGGQ